VETPPGGSPRPAEPPSARTGWRQRERGPQVVPGVARPRANPLVERPWGITAARDTRAARVGGRRRDNLDRGRLRRSSPLRRPRAERGPSARARVEHAKVSVGPDPGGDSPGRCPA